jgi:hypothetical protein
MSQKSPILTLPILATAILTASRFVSPTGGVAGAGLNAIGVTDTDAASGDIVAVDAVGTSIVTAGEPITKGASLEVGAAGKAVVLDAGVKVAVALEAAGADGDRIEVLLIPN